MIDGIIMQVKTKQTKIRLMDILTLTDNNSP